MSIPIIHNGNKYFISDVKTLQKYNYFFMGFLYLNNTRYKKYIITGNKTILIEV